MFKFLSKDFNWSKWGFWIGTFSILISIIWGIITLILNEKYSKLEIITIAQSPVFTINENIRGLKITYLDKELLSNKKNLTTFTIRIINSGNIAVLKEYFDDQYKYGIQIKNGEIIDKPIIIDATDTSYYQSSVYDYTLNKITLNEQIYNPGEYFELRFLTYHDIDSPPIISAFGKVANQPNLEILRLTQLANTELILPPIVYLLFIAGIGIIAITIAFGRIFFPKIETMQIKEEIERLEEKDRQIKKMAEYIESKEEQIKQIRKEFEKEHTYVYKMLQENESRVRELNKIITTEKTQISKVFLDKLIVIIWKRIIEISDINKTKTAKQIEKEKEKLIAEIEKTWKNAT